MEIIDYWDSSLRVLSFCSEISLGTYKDKSLLKIDVFPGFNIPDDWAKHTHLTIMEYGHQLSKLAVIPAAIYPEFYELKIQMLYDVVREAKITSGLEEGTEEELAEIRERLDSIQERLNQITEFPIN